MSIWGLITSLIRKGENHEKNLQDNIVGICFRTLRHLGNGS